MTGAPHAPDGPAPPRPIGIPDDEWREVRSQPELACVVAWSRACRSWWQDPSNPRLRRWTLENLGLTDAELRAWLGQPLDAAALIRAHGHVISMRAAVERDVSRRHLDGGALRTGEIWVRHRDGGIRKFMPPAEVPSYVDRICAQAARMPADPVVRAAWFLQSIGAVHPFRDANGGTSRLLASLELARAWLPPLVLSFDVRHGLYIDAVVETSRTERIERLAMMVSDIVQRGIARALMADGGPTGAWDGRSKARAARWTGLAGRSLCEAVGAPLGAVIDRNGTAPAGARWTVAAPVPIHVDLAISPLCAGATTWLHAALTMNVGGALAPLELRETISPLLVAVADEADEVADARFRRWIDARIAHLLRGCAQWL